MDTDTAVCLTSYFQVSFVLCEMKKSHFMASNGTSSLLFLAPSVL